MAFLKILFYITPSNYLIFEMLKINSCNQPSQIPLQAGIINGWNPYGNLK